MEAHCCCFGTNRFYLGRGVQVIASGVDAAEMERRAQHMREQREALIAKKKAARNEKVTYTLQSNRSKHRVVVEHFTYKELPSSLCLCS